MASENVELVRSIYADWERGDFSSAEWAHPEIEFEIVGGPGTGTWKGLAGMAEGFRETILRPMEQYRVEPEEVRELDDERVLVLTRVRGRGRMSGLDLDQLQTKAATLLHIRDSKVTKLVIYGERDDALADLGLKE